jgi:anthrone oxygenase-like protein
MQATSAAVSLLSSVAAWLAGASFRRVVAGVLLGSVIPFTLVAILPTNKRLLRPQNWISDQPKQSAC